MSPTGDDSELLKRSNAYYREGVLDVERWAKIAGIPDYSQIIGAYDWASAFAPNDNRDAVTILDCGCGVGHFPRLLASNVAFPSTTRIEYDTLDPSSYSLAEHRRNLAPPFVPRHSFKSTVEDFHFLPWSGQYDIVWCMHSLYTVALANLPTVITTLTGLLAGGGKCFIYLPRRTSTYMLLFDMYQNSGAHGADLSYLAAESVLDELSARPSLEVQSVDCSFDQWIATSEPETLANYLNQACLSTRPRSFAEWQQDSRFGVFIDAAFDEAHVAWRFRQDLTLIAFSREQ